jgi:hypothetical protein
MKLQTPTANSQKQKNQQNNQNQQETTRHTHQLQINSSIQGNILSLGANNHIMHTSNYEQIAGEQAEGNQQPEGTIKTQITPAKRQEMETEEDNRDEVMLMDYQRVGHAQQASPRP